MKIHHFIPKKEKHGLLWQIFVFVAVIHVILLVTFGSYVVSRTILEDDEVMAPPPITDAQDIKPKVNKVIVERQNKKSSKPSRRISIANPNSSNPPEVNVNLPASFGSGMGISPISSKTMMSDLKVSTTTVSLFGQENRTEKVMICVDAGPDLMTDERGGLDTYKVIKDEIKTLINQLPPTCLFNLMVYDLSNNVDFLVYRQNLVSATRANKKDACDWISPYNVSLKNIGVRWTNYQLKYPYLPQPPASPTYWPGKFKAFRIYQAALEQGADTIYILATGWPDADQMAYPFTDAEVERQHKAEERYKEAVERKMKSAGWDDDAQAKYDEACAVAKAEGIKKAREWIKTENERRAKRNIPLYTRTVEQAMWEKGFYKEPSPKPPKIDVPKPKINYKFYGNKGVLKYYDTIGLFRDIYYKRNARPPVVTMIIFRAQKDTWTSKESRVVRSFASANGGGSCRVLKGLKSVNEYDAPAAKADTKKESEKKAAAGAEDKNKKPRKSKKSKEK